MSQRDRHKIYFYHFVLFAKPKYKVYHSSTMTREGCVIKHIADKEYNPSFKLAVLIFDEEVAAKLLRQFRKQTVAENRENMIWQRLRAWPEYETGF